LTRKSFIPSLQSDALAREIERQIRDESRAVSETAKRAGVVVVAQAHAAARRQMHSAIEELRREGARRLSRAKAQVETGQRERAQQQAAAAVREAWPLLHDALAARWSDPRHRLSWVSAAALECRTRLRPGAWVVEHPADWNAREHQDFLGGLGLRKLGTRGGDEIAFKADQDVTAGIRIRADQATLDATPQGLLADRSTITALLLAEIGQGMGASP
jgi:hypothetical protein